MTVSFRIVDEFGIDGGEEKLEVRKCGVRLVYKGDETSTYCTFPLGATLPESWRWPDIDSECSSYTEEGDESHLQTCSPCNLLTNFFMLLKHICGFR